MFYLSNYFVSLYQNDTTPSKQKTSINHKGQDKYQQNRSYKSTFNSQLQSSSITGHHHHRHLNQSNTINTRKVTRKMSFHSYLIFFDACGLQSNLLEQMNMLGIENLSPKQTISYIQKFMEEDQAQIFKATPSYLEIVKNCTIRNSKNFKVFTTIEQLLYQYKVEMHISDHFIITQVEKIGFDRFLHIINEINMNDNNKFTLIWDQQKYEILLRTNVSKFQKDTQVIKQNLHRFWQELTQFIQSLFPLQKQVVSENSPSQKYELINKSIAKGMKKWKRLITARRKLQLSRKMDRQFCITKWFYQVKEYRLLFEEKLKVNLQKPVVMQYFDIKNQRYEENYISAKFSQVKAVELEYIALKGSHSLSNLMKEQKITVECQSENSLKSVFIEKTPLYWNPDPFNQQVSIIKYLRNQKCSFLSQYFFEFIDKERFYNPDLSRFYMPKYPHKFTTDLRTREKFKLTRDLTKGIQFLQSSLVVHRDLKPDNVVLDSSLSPKIIDFGSSIRNDLRDSKISDSQPIITTRAYNLLWEQLPCPIKILIDRHYFNRHRLFDIYALGKILDVTLRTQKIREKMGEFAMQFIDTLVNWCRSKHPDDRLYPIEIIFFLNNFCGIKKPSNIKTAS